MVHLLNCAAQHTERLTHSTVSLAVCSMAGFCGQSLQKPISSRACKQLLITKTLHSLPKLFRRQVARWQGGGAEARRFSHAHYCSIEMARKCNDAAAQ